MARYELEWLLPIEPGLLTHATLRDRTSQPESVIAIGHGADEAETLLDLWTTLIEHHDRSEAVSYVAQAYEKRTGHPPEPTAG